MTVFAPAAKRQTGEPQWMGSKHWEMVILPQHLGDPFHHEDSHSHPVLSNSNSYLKQADKHHRPWQWIHISQPVRTGLVSGPVHPSAWSPAAPIPWLHHHADPAHRAPAARGSLLLVPTSLPATSPLAEAQSRTAPCCTERLFGDPTTHRTGELNF